MTLRQRFLKWVYPAWMKLAGWLGNNKIKSHHMSSSPVSFYSLKAEANNGSTFDFGTLRDKKVLIVNTASHCGYTNQYQDLQQLWEQNKDKLVVIAFPANDFKEQEKGSDEEIAQFCQVNFGVSFPLMKKSTVIRGTKQNPVFQWLTDPQKNGWNSQEPTWNFSKYLINEKGLLTNYFDPAVSPVGPEIRQSIEKA